MEYKLWDEERYEALKKALPEFDDLFYEACCWQFGKYPYVQVMGKGWRIDISEDDIHAEKTIDDLEEECLSECNEIERKQEEKEPHETWDDGWRRFPDCEPPIGKRMMLHVVSSDGKIGHVIATWDGERWLRSLDNKQIHPENAGTVWFAPWG
jgi:hypothetical protein